MLLLSTNDAIVWLLPLDYDWCEQTIFVWIAQICEVVPMEASNLIDDYLRFFESREFSPSQQSNERDTSWLTNVTGEKGEHNGPIPCLLDCWKHHFYESGLLHLRVKIEAISYDFIHIDDRSR